MWVCHERRPSGLNVQLATELIVLAHELVIFLFELADAHRWWWQSRDLFRRERKGRLELRYGLLELLDVGLSFGAMPRLGLCITAPFRAFGERSGLGIGGCLSHVE
jgi:hypothetical protein